MILEIEANTGKVNNGLDTNFPELLGISDATALKDQWGRECTTRNDHLLAGTENARSLLFGELHQKFLNRSRGNFLRLGEGALLEQSRPPLQPHFP